MSDRDVKFKMVDNKGRSLLTQYSSGDVVIEHYNDMTQKDKKITAFYYNKLTGEDIEKTLKFLNFEEELFCS